jgi:hypothetical protein
MAKKNIAFEEFVSDPKPVPSSEDIHKVLPKKIHD